jgi:hypothetical protein
MAKEELMILIEVGIKQLLLEEEVLVHSWCWTLDKKG